MLVGTGNQQPTNRQPRGSRVSRYSTGTIHAVPAPKLVDQVNSTYNKPAPASLGSVDTGTLPVRYRYATGTLPVRYRYATGTLPVRYRYQSLGLLTRSIVPTTNQPPRVSGQSIPVPYRYPSLGFLTGSIVPICNKTRVSRYRYHTCRTGA
jgi:hypothetical protein